MIKLEKRGNRIELITNSPLPGFRKAIPGAYQRTNGMWTVPLDIETCKLLKERYGSELSASSELKRWARLVRTNRNSMARIAKSEDAKLFVIPKMAPRIFAATRKRRYQRTGIRFIADSHATLEADEPGLGKTLITLGGVIESEVPGPYLVIAPKTASQSVWQAEIRRWLPRYHRPVIMPEGRVQRLRRLRLVNYGPHTWVIVHPRMITAQQYHICQQCESRTVLKKRTQKKLDCGHIKTVKTKKEMVYSYPKLFDIEWGAIIADESHEILIHRQGVPAQQKRGIDNLKIRADGIKIAVSGTPFNSRPFQLWGTLNWLDSKMHPAFHRWVELYWRKEGYNNYQIGDFIDEREAMLWRSLDSIAVRRTKAEVASDLPPKQEMGTRINPKDPFSPIGIWLPMNPQQEKAYNQMLEDSTAQLDSGRLEAITALAELTRLKQLACSYGDIERRKIWVSCVDYGCPGCDREWHREYRFKFIPSLPSNKFQWTVDTLEEWGYPTNPIDKVVIVSQYTSLLEMFGRELEKHFKTKPNNPLTTAITGKVSRQKRFDVINRFNQSDNEHIMLLNVKAGGVAITIDSADRMIFLSQTRIPTQQTQAEDRIHRISNPRHCFYYYLSSLNTVDVGTVHINKELLSDTHRLLDTRRGVEYLRLAIDLSK